MLTVYLIRHAQSANNALSDQSQRVPDPALTELGLRQAERLAAYIAQGDERDLTVDIRSGYSVRVDQQGFGITHVYSSAMYRALLTAYPLSRALGLTPEIWLDLHEEGGVYVEEGDQRTGKPGKTRSEVMSEFPGFTLPDTVTDEGWWGVHRGFETRTDAFQRARRIVGELTARAEADEVIALITHGTFIDRILKILLEQTEDARFYYLHYNTGITRLDFMEHKRVLIRYLNRIDHLETDLMS